MHIIDVVPSNMQRGGEADFYIRKDGKTEIERRVVGDLYFSGRVNKDDADYLLAMVQPHLDPFGIRARVIQSANKYVVTFLGQRDIKARSGSMLKSFLSDYFQSKPGESLNLRYPPLTLPNSPHSQVSVETLMSESWCSLDTEVYRAFEEDPYLYMTALTRENDGVVYTTLDTGREEMSVDGKLVSIERCETPAEIAEKSAIRIRDWDPRFLIIFNAGFDLHQSKRAGGYVNDRKPGVFKIGTDGSVPTIEGGIPGSNFKKWVVRGRDVIDPFPWHRNHAWFPDNRLETVANFRGIRFQKRFAGEELDGVYERAHKDPNLAFELAYYCASDAINTGDLARRTMPLIFAASLDFRTDPTTTGFRSHAVTKYYDFFNLEDLGTIRGNADINVDMHAEKRKLMGLGSSEQGSFPVRVLYIPLFERALGRYLSGRFPHLFNHRAEDVVDHVMALILREKSAVELLQDYRTSPDNVFAGKHGIGKQEVSALLGDAVDRYKRILSQGMIVNAAGPFVVLKDDERDYDDVIEYGRGRALSINNGSIVVDINGRRIGLGMDIRGNRGYKTDFERELIEELIDTVLVKDDPEKMFHVTEQRLTELTGDVDRKKLVYSIKDVSIPWYGISQRAAGRRRSKVVQENQMIEGESKRYGVVLIDRTPTNIDEEEFLNSMHPIAVGDYIQKWREGAPGNIMHAVHGRTGRRSLSLQMMLI